MGLFTKKTPPTDDRWEALQAEYQNYRRRTALELEAAGDQAARKTAAAFLAVYDDLQRALDSTCTDPAFYKGGGDDPEKSHGCFRIPEDPTHGFQGQDFQPHLPRSHGADHRSPIPVQRDRGSPPNRLHHGRRSPPPRQSHRGKLRISTLVPPLSGNADEKLVGNGLDRSGMEMLRFRRRFMRIPNSLPRGTVKTVPYGDFISAYSEGSAKRRAKASACPDCHRFAILPIHDTISVSTQPPPLRGAP